MAINNVPVPGRMQHLKRDARGYPIPWGVFIDDSGLPHFAINNEHIRIKCLRDDLCSICGGKLFRGRWFVGGALSAFHEHGAFIDPPMHSECAHYAVKVCPYLAAPRYGKEIGLQKIMNAPTPDAMIVADPTMMPGRPHGEMFVALMATRSEVFDNFNCRPIKPYSRIEFWRHGERIGDAEGVALTQQALDALAMEEAG